MGDHKEFLKRITKTLYYGELPSLPCLSLPVTEVSCALWSAAQQGRSLRRLHADAAARLARGACVSPCALVLALLYLERLRLRNPNYLAAAAPAELFLVSLMVGNKFLQDDGEDEEVMCSEWAAAGGLPLSDLKRMEIEFLNAIEWNVFVNDESFESGLAGLERHVALKQAAARGFFTYGDLAAAGGGAGALGAAAAAATLALACAAAVGALLASALLVSHALAAPAALDAPARPARPAGSPANASVDPFRVGLVADPARPRCCTDWLKYHETIETDKSWSAGAVLAAWTPAESASVLGWLYRSSVVDPVQRWLEQLAGYAEPPRPDAHTRQWLNLSRLGALAAAVSDR